MNYFRFSDTYRCISSAANGSPELEETGRILLPIDALNSIYQAGFDETRDGIMLFCIRNVNRGTEAYSGVENFTMPPGQVCIPYWLMEFLQLKENDLVNISFSKPPMAKKAVLQPLSSAFFQIPNPGVVLEFTLRSHPCLTQGTIIVIKFNNKTYKLKVLKTEPKNSVQIFKADIVCEFAQAVDQFKHHWNEPDVDSSDGDFTPQVKEGRTINGKVVKETETPKPIHSTFAQREKDRLQGNVFRTKEIVQGQEIPPPKPPENSKNKEQKVNYLEGHGQVIKKKKGKKGAAATPNPPPPVQIRPESTNDQENAQQPPKNTINKSYFTGVGHTVKGETTQGISVPPPQPPQQQQNDAKEKQTSSFFSGASRTIKNPSQPQQQPQPSNPPPQQQMQNNNSNTKKSFFDGPSRKIKQ